MDNNRWFNDRANEPWHNQTGRNIVSDNNTTNNNTSNSGNTLLNAPVNQACKYVTAHGICQTYQSFINNGDTQSAMQAVSTFAYQENIPAAFAYNLILQCCGDANTGEIPCEDFWPSVQQQQGWCQKWAQAQQSGNQLQIQSEIANLATAFNITNAQAESVFMRCCPGTSSGEPCPPSDPNSPYYTTDYFCTSDWCVDGQGNPSPNAHPDCVCCPGDNTGPCPPSNPNSPYNTNAPEFCPNCVPGGYYYGHPDCICCPGNNEIDVTPWCDQYVQAVDNADLTTIQQIITQVSNTFNITWQQAAQLLYDVCICPDGSDVCKDPNWQQLPPGGMPGEPNYPGGKNNYCDRCNQGNGSFPVSWNSSGGWQYDPQNGTDYCGCCPSNPDGPCDGFVDNGCCSKCDAANGDPTTNNMGGLPLMGPNHQCSQFCDQYGSTCCPTNTNQGGGGGTGTTMPVDTPQGRLTMPGTTDNPIGLGSLTNQRLSFSGSNNQPMPGDFLTDDPGDTQSLDEFMNDIP